MTAPLFGTSNSCRALMDLHPALRDKPVPETRDKTCTPTPKPKLHIRAVSLCTVAAIVIGAGVVIGLM